MKWPKSEEKLKFGGKMVSVFESIPPPPSQNFGRLPWRIHVKTVSTDPKQDT